MSEITLNIYGKGNKREPVKVLTAEGYACAVCYTADEAIKVIENYNGGKLKNENTCNAFCEVNGE